MALFDLSKLLLQLEQTQQASPKALRFLMTEPNIEPALFAAADRVRRQHYGTAVYLRGLIEFTNYCKKRLLLLRHPCQQYSGKTLPTG